MIINTKLNRTYRIMTICSFDWASKGTYKILKEPTKYWQYDKDDHNITEIGASLQCSCENRTYWHSDRFDQRRHEKKIDWLTKHARSTICMSFLTWLPDRDLPMMICFCRLKSRPLVPVLRSFSIFASYIIPWREPFGQKRKKVSAPPNPVHCL